jgi:tRNA threonylcarbamoyladenosine biosynthesis protein TsaE
MEFVFTLDTIREIAARFWKLAGDTGVIAFYGPMGAGKTTFIHALCDVKKVKDAVGSPTFSIINEYFFEEKGIVKKIFHIDLYRLKDEKEALEAGVEDCFYSDHTCLVEWAEKAPGLLPANTLHVHIQVLDNVTRELRIGNN